jgi:hypothetical protein
MLPSAASVTGCTALQWFCLAGVSVACIYLVNEYVLETALSACVCAWPLTTPKLQAKESSRSPGTMVSSTLASPLTDRNRTQGWSPEENGEMDASKASKMQSSGETVL